MNAVVCWFMTALILVVLAGWIGSRVTQKGPLGILIDDRERYRLTHLQVVLRSLVLISLLAGIVRTRATNGLPPAEWLNIKVLIGISHAAYVGGKFPERTGAPNPGSLNRWKSQA